MEKRMIKAVFCVLFLAGGSQAVLGNDEGMFSKKDLQSGQEREKVIIDVKAPDEGLGTTEALRDFIAETNAKVVGEEKQCGGKKDVVVHLELGKNCSDEALVGVVGGVRNVEKLQIGEPRFKKGCFWMTVDIVKGDKVKFFLQPFLDTDTKGNTEATKKLNISIRRQIGLICDAFGIGDKEYEICLAYLLTNTCFLEQFKHLVLNIENITRVEFAGAREINADKTRNMIKKYLPITVEELFFCELDFVVNKYFYGFGYNVKRRNKKLRLITCASDSGVDAEELRKKLRCNVDFWC